jgi:hypothetical protein
MNALSTKDWPFVQIDFTERRKTLVLGLES